MQLEPWDNTTNVSFDRALWAELCSLRFALDSYNVLIMGPVGVGKTFLVRALGHAAIRRASASGPDICSGCYRPPAAVCTVCAQHRPCTGITAGKAICAAAAHASDGSARAAGTAGPRW